MGKALSAHDRQSLSGLAMVAEVCVRALVNEPAQGIVDDVRHVAQGLGSTRFDEVKASDDLHRRYYDRFFVSSSPLFVPLVESCVLGVWEDQGFRRFGTFGGPAADHVSGCYRALGFDYRAIRGYDLAVQRLRPDSMASELAFIALLARSACSTDAGVEAAVRSGALLCQFAHEHALRWFAAAAGELRRTDDDFYAGMCEIAANVLDAWCRESEAVSASEEYRPKSKGA